MDMPSGSGEWSWSMLVLVTLDIRPRFLGALLGLESLDPKGLPHIFFIRTGRVGSKKCVALAHVRPFQISRTAFSLTPNNNASCTGFGQACFELFAVSFKKKISMACASLRTALGLDELVRGDIWLKSVCPFGRKFWQSFFWLVSFLFCSISTAAPIRNLGPIGESAGNILSPERLFFDPVTMDAGFLRRYHVMHVMLATRLTRIRNQLC